MAARLCWELKVYVLLPTVHRTRTLSKMQFEWRRNLPTCESTTRLRRNWHKYPQRKPNSKRLAFKNHDESSTRIPLSWPRIADHRYGKGSRGEVSRCAADILRI